MNEKVLVAHMRFSTVFQNNEGFKNWRTYRTLIYTTIYVTKTTFTIVNK